MKYLALSLALILSGRTVFAGGNCKNQFLYVCSAEITVAGAPAGMNPVYFTANEVGSLTTDQLYQKCETAADAAMARTMFAEKWSDASGSVDSVTIQRKVKCY